MGLQQNFFGTTVSKSTCYSDSVRDLSGHFNEFDPKANNMLLSACAGGNNSEFINLLVQKPYLLYQMLNVPASITNKTTNILTHIIELGNIALLRGLIEAGLGLEIKDFLGKTQYNILYQSNPNHSYHAEQELYQRITHTEEWNDLLDLLVANHILPVEKIEDFYNTVIGKPQLLKKAFDEHYFDLGRTHYWEVGFKPKKQGWMIFEVMNRSITHTYQNFKHLFSDEFITTALGEIAYCNQQSCLYWPDLIIYHDDVSSLHNLIAIDREATKNWFKHRVYFIEKNLLVGDIFNCLKEDNMVDNWLGIHNQYNNPWHFIKNTLLPLTEEPQMQDRISINTIDYALLCQSSHCLAVLLDLIGFTSLLEEPIKQQAPSILKTHLNYHHLHRSLSPKKNLFKRHKI